MRALLLLSVLSASIALGAARNPRKGTAAVTNPLHGDADAANSGQKLYSQDCAGCHGPEAKGASHYPSLRSAKVRKISDAGMFNVISKGVPAKGMPAFAQLSETQRWQIVTYLRSLK